MSVERSNVRRCRFQVIAFFRLFNFQGRAPAENLGHKAPMSRIEMLHYHEHCRQAFGKTCHDNAERFEPTGVSRDRYDVEFALPLDRDEPRISSLMVFSSPKIH